MNGCREESENMAAGFRESQEAGKNEGRAKFIVNIFRVCSWCFLHKGDNTIIWFCG